MLNASLQAGGLLMMTSPACLNYPRCVLRRRGEHGSNQPQVAALKRNSTDGRCHSKRPLPLIPARAKSDPGRNRPAILNRYRLDLLIRSSSQASGVVAQ
jgi:hypothetical protein